MGALRVGRGGLEALAEGPEALGADRGDAVLVLEGALHQEEGLARDGQSVAPEQGRAHDHVDELGLVLQVQEAQAPGVGCTLYLGHAGHLGARRRRRKGDVMVKGVRFLVDDVGRRTAVQIDLKKQARLGGVGRAGLADHEGP